MNAQVAALTACALGAFLLRRRSVKYTLKDKVVVITGGSRGLGLALAREFARHQARLALVARDTDELERAPGDLQSLGANVRTWACDAQDERDVAQTILVTGSHALDFDLVRP